MTTNKKTTKTTDVYERLYNRQTETISVYERLRRFQASMPTITKNKQVNLGSYTFSYAPLGEVLNQIRPVLNKHRLSVRHTVSVEEIATGVLVKVAAFVCDPHGECISSGVFAMPVKGDARQIGAAITYGRRYTLTSLLGIEGEDDKDVEAFELAKNAQSYVYSRQKKTLLETNDPDTIERIYTLLKQEKSLLEKGEKSKTGLTMTQVEELMELAELRKEELSA